MMTDTMYVRMIRRTALSFALLLSGFANEVVFAQENSNHAERGSAFKRLRDASSAPEATRTPVAIAFAAVPLQDALQEIARQAGLGISYRSDLPELDRRISLEADGLPAAEALLRVLRGSGLELMVAPNGRTVMVRAQAALRADTTCAVGGSVRAAETGQPLAAVDVRLSAGAARTITRRDGSFCIPRVPNGSYTLEAGLLGYTAVRLDSVIVPGPAARQLAITLAPAAIPLADFVVTPGHFGIAHETTSRQQTLKREQIETLPQLAEDIYRTVNRLPGVVSNEMSAKFYVRGGDDKSMLVLLDGLELVEPFHLKDFDGALSILDVAAIGGVDLTTGGFSAEYGNRLTGVFDLRTTNQLYTRPRTSLGISLSNARIMSQGSFAGGDGLWLVSARRGYLDILLRMIGEGDNVDPRYYDGLAKVVYQLSPRHRISARVLRAGDTAHLVDEADAGANTLESRYGSTYGWLTWQADPSDRLSIATQFSVGALDWNRRANRPAGDTPYEVRDLRAFDYFAGRQDWRLSVSERVALKWGIEARRGSADYDYSKRVSGQRVVDGRLVAYTDSGAAALAPTATDLGIYVAQRIRPWAPLTMEAGLRWDRQSSTEGEQLSPRVNLALALNRNTTLRGAWGRYAQPQALYQLHVQDDEYTFNQAERAQQFVAGLERQFGAGISARLETYRRNESELRPRYRNLSNEILAVAEVEDDRVRLDPERGRAQGIELLLQRNGARSSGALSYAWARAYDEVAGQRIDRPLDQRHTFYLDYSFAPSTAWRFSGSWQYHSGWPITTSTFHADTLDGRSLSIIREFGEPYAARLPAYHRLDLRVTRNFDLRRGRLAIFLDVFNLYDRDNPQAYNYNVRYSRDNGLEVRRHLEPLLPRLPTFGASWEF
jgi:outer membrane cobalamin receptor